MEHKVFKEDSSGSSFPPNKEKYTERNGSSFLGDVRFIFLVLLANKRGGYGGRFGKNTRKMLHLKMIKIV